MRASGSLRKYMHIAPSTHIPKKRQKKARVQQKQTTALNSTAPDYLETFFALYPGFEYDSSNAATDEFRRMSDSFEWDKPDREEARAKFKDALVQEFNNIYGTDENDVGSWQGLCRVLGITPVPGSLAECRKVVNTSHVNLVDLVGQPNSITLFTSEAALSEYTKDTGKFFPKENAYAGGLLKYLLRNIANPGVRRGTARRRRKH